jgi:hypothetical protein
VGRWGEQIEVPFKLLEEKDREYVLRRLEGGERGILDREDVEWARNR